MKPILRQHLIQIFTLSVERVTPRNLLPERIKVFKNKLIVDNHAFNLNKNVYVVGFGKGVYGMMRAIEDLLHVHLNSGILSVPCNTLNGIKDGERLKTGKVKVLEGAKNNLPDNEAEHNAKEIMKMVASVSDEDLLIVLTTGGGSALLPSPIPPLRIEEKKEAIRLLSNSGANIHEVNSVRKQLSQVKGGKLALMAARTKTIALILSDVIDDPLDVIAGGPTVRNTDHPDLALNILAKYDLLTKIPKAAVEVLRSPSSQSEEKNFSHVFNCIIGNNSLVVEKAESLAENLGYEPAVLTKSLQGEAKLVGINISKLIHVINQYTKDVLQSRDKLQNILKDMNIPENSVQHFISATESLTSRARNICLIVGGETVVKVKGTGIGGRNQELALSCAIHSNSNYPCDNKNWMMLSAGTDGIDGPTDSAGAIAYADLVEDASNFGITNISDYLDNNDSNTFFTLFRNGENLVTTGHTGTNVMDLLLVFILLKE